MAPGNPAHLEDKPGGRPAVPTASPTARPWRWAAGLLLATAALAIAASTVDPARPETVTLVVKGHLFVLKLAATPEARERGLMERLDVPPDQGMLFVFLEEAPRRFWMKHTRVDLDIVYLDNEGRVVSTATMHPETPQGEREPEAQYEDRLPLYPSSGPARFAIEFSSGTLDLLQLAPGDRIDLDLDRLKALAR